MSAVERKAAVVVMGEDDEEEEEDKIFIAMQPTLSSAGASVAAPEAPSDSAAFLLVADSSSTSSTSTSSTSTTSTNVSNESLSNASTPKEKDKARSQLERSVREKNQRVRDLSCARTSAFYVATNKDLHKAHTRLGKSLAVAQESLNVSAGNLEQLQSLISKLDILKPVV
jgi:hypothetical protein